VGCQRQDEEGPDDQGAGYGGAPAPASRRLVRCSPIPRIGCAASLHSDRGSQYCSYDYQKKLQAYGLRPSMSGKGNCYDTASVETFFKSLKAELIWRPRYEWRRQAEAAIFQYINGFYNTRRRHSYLGGISPLAFEAKVA
jgi:putative transposase